MSSASAAARGTASQYLSISWTTATGRHSTAQLCETCPMRLSTTSYAILGLLDLRPWTAYELTKHMRRNLHYFFPRAESGIYGEFKKLTTSGLATAEASSHGNR